MAQFSGSLPQLKGMNIAPFLSQMSDMATKKKLVEIERRKAARAEEIFSQKQEKYNYDKSQRPMEREKVNKDVLSGVMTRIEEGIRLSPTKSDFEDDAEGLLEYADSLPEENPQLKKAISTYVENVRNLPDDEYTKVRGDYMKKSTENNGPVFKQKIEELMKEVPGITRDVATKIQTGALKVQKDPVTNEISIVDLASGTVTTPTIANEKAAEEEEIRALEERINDKKPRRTIWQAAEGGTGPISAAKDAASRISGMVGGPVAEDTIQKRQFISSAQNDLIRSLSINPRFPVGEINRIKKEIDISPSVFDNPKHMKQRILAIEDYLLGRVEKEASIYGDRRSPASQRQASIQAINDIEHFLKILGIPTRIRNDEDYKDIKSGESFIDPNGKERIKP